MAKKKIVISSEFIESLAKEEPIDNISLKFTLSEPTRILKVDLTPLVNNTLQRRKDLKKFKDFLINFHQSISTKDAIYNSFRKFVLFVGNDFNSQNNLIEVIQQYAINLNKKVEEKKLTSQSYSSYRWQLRTVFNECYGISHLEFAKVFPEGNGRTGVLTNPMILDYQGEERFFSKDHFKEITKILLSFNTYLEDLINDRNKEKYYIFSYKNIYKIELNYASIAKRQLQNKNTVCLMLVFIALTGLNVEPLLKLKRSDLVIDIDNSIISFKTICSRKGKEQNHIFPTRKNQLLLFQKTIENSKSIAPNKDILFPYINNSILNNEISYFQKRDFVSFYEIFNKGFYGEYKSVKITSRKLRHAFGSQFEDIDLRSVALFNSVNTAAKHYSTGNGKENTKQLQNAMNIYTIALSNSEDIQIVRNNIEKINIIKIKDIQSLKEENSQITSSGIFCINSKTGSEPEKFARKLEKLNLENIQSINCANILACFNCKNSILVNDFENIYLLKSFYQYLKDIIYETDTSSLFNDKNAVKSAMVAIQIILETKIDKKIIKKVDSHIKQYGNHPLWNIEE